MTKKINIEQIKEDAKGEIKEEQVWLLTYADMMTLLFAFFVLLYSMSSPDPVKASQIQEAMAKEVGIEKPEEQQIKSQSEINESLKEIIEEFSLLFNYTKKIEETAPYPLDPTGITNNRYTRFILESGDEIQVSCKKFEKNLKIKNNWKDGLSVTLYKKEVSYWMRNY